MASPMATRPVADWSSSRSMASWRRRSHVVLPRRGEVEPYPVDKGEDYLAAVASCLPRERLGELELLGEASALGEAARGMIVDAAHVDHLHILLPHRRRCRGADEQQQHAGRHPTANVGQPGSVKYSTLL
eukprot:scaffold59245_cov36-Tisochrysis_lutea.AAC.4